MKFKIVFKKVLFSKYKELKKFEILDSKLMKKSMTLGYLFLFMKGVQEDYFYRKR